MIECLTQIIIISNIAYIFKYYIIYVLATFFVCICLIKMVCYTLLSFMRAWTSFPNIIKIEHLFIINNCNLDDMHTLIP